MKVFYWSPFFSNIATISAVINSAKSLVKHSKDKKYSVNIINAIGEWNSYKKVINKEIIVKNLLNKDYTKTIPKGSFLKSRISYIFIFTISSFKLLKLINLEKPDFLVIHLITSLPIFLSPFFNKKTKIILRLSGLPKLNFLRLAFWKLYSCKIDKITCPTQSTFDNMVQSKIFNREKIFLLKDPVINIKDIIKKKNLNLDDSIKKEKYIIGVGRLTFQKNFELLLNFYSKLLVRYPEYKLYILGEGEDRNLLSKIIVRKKLENKAFLLGHKNNVFKYLKYADCFILTSLWEDPGFVLIEAGCVNTNIIASDCPNGPSEIINNKDFLFVNNSCEDLFAKFKIFKSKSEGELFKQKIEIKKKVKSYTLFQHYKNFDTILNK